MLTEYQIKTLDGILSEFHKDRDAIFDTGFDYVFRGITGSNDRKQWFLETIANDGFLEFDQREEINHAVFPSGGSTTVTYAHITAAGVEFYESGGYAAQNMAVELARHQDNLLREREVRAAERSAESSEQSSASSERSAKSAEKANFWGRLSIFLNVVALLVGTSLTVWQIKHSSEQDNRVDTLATQVERLDSLMNINHTSQPKVDENASKKKSIVHK